MARNSKKWIQTIPQGEPTGWRKTDAQAVRRKIVLKSRHGDILAAARAMNLLANKTRDPDTKRKARGDARYFYGKYRRSKKA